MGVVLAAGEGRRLQPPVRRLRGDDLPKQYVSFIGSRSMLEHTFDRVEKVISRENIFTVVSNVKTLLDIVRDVEPDLYASFQKVLEAIGTRKEKSRLREIYRRLEPMNFSRGVMEMLPLSRPSCLSVLSVRGVLWSDWGLPRSIASVLKRTGRLERRYPANGASESRLFRIFSYSVEPERESPWGAALNGVNQSPVVPEAFKRFAPGPGLTPDG